MNLNPKQFLEHLHPARGSGGFKVDPATINVEADAIEERCKWNP